MYFSCSVINSSDFPEQTRFRLLKFFICQVPFFVQSSQPLQLVDHIRLGCSFPCFSAHFLERQQFREALHCLRFKDQGCSTACRRVNLYRCAALVYLAIFRAVRSPSCKLV